MPAVATAASRAPAARDRRPPPRRRSLRAASGAATLDERITGLWSRLVADGRADCPVCGGELLAGRPCGGCGAELS